MTPIKVVPPKVAKDEPKDKPLATYGLRPKVEKKDGD